MSVGASLLLALPAAGVLAGVVRPLLLYPARLTGWRFTFGSEHDDARRNLHEARLRKRTLKRNHRRKVNAAERHIRTVKKQGRKHVRDLEKEHAKILYPGPGAYLNGLGRVQVYEHVLRIFDEDPEEEDAPGEYEELHLDGLRLDFKPGAEISFIEVTDQDGVLRSVDFPGYSVHDVAGIRQLIHNQALEDSKFRAQAPELEERIRQAKAVNANAEKTARDERDELLLAWPTNPDRIEAEDTWQAECDVWQALTGRRPQWWWRW